MAHISPSHRCIAPGSLQLAPVHVGITATAAADGRPRVKHSPRDLADADLASPDPCTSNLQTSRELLTGKSSMENGKQAAAQQVITPWLVESGGADLEYHKICQEFGASLISQDLVRRVERLTKAKAYRFLRRGIFFAHRDLEALLDHYEASQPFYLYTGRGPSSEALHLGHLVPFHFTAWMQRTFKVPLVIQLTDDEKFLWRGLSLPESERLAFENAKDIIACGFDPDLTFIFSDYDYIGGDFYWNITQIQRLVTFNSVRSIFGLAGDDSIGKIAFPAIQAAPSFPSSFPHIFHDAASSSKNVKCLIPCAIDQDPYFRMTRDGDSGKMSASDQTSAVFVTDTPEEIKGKVYKHAFSGGKDTLEQQLSEGADLSTDVPFKWLSFFLEDDEELADIGRRYATGDRAMLTGHVKQRLVEVLTDLVQQHQKARAAVTDADVHHFMAVRPMTHPI
ncbi:hypothetical protein WJX74_004419 [Apatococcus lobatus]|uniref:Tryptophan--tRNA ligase, cytoplasmic n=1 Tax=Apatococcus lobatus TaxID=904363 RepID=A0AAW1RSK3_9CHLO